jgi:hypothetical protein
MHITATHMSVADYCQGMTRHEIEVNRDYQRSDRVWPPAARSFLIETILLGYPIPKFSLHQVTDLRTRQSKKQIIDGQQRSRAILDFYSNDLRLSTTLELADARGRTYDQLSAELQADFMTYALSIDQFEGATPAQVREVFRRINSYTIPLNPEEQRHATYQGPFKWYVHRLTRDFDQANIQMGVFAAKQLVRMADAKLFTEVSHALLFGIQTTNKRKLDDLYRSRDVDFPEESRVDRLVRAAMDTVIAMPQVHQTELMKPHQFYALILAVIHLQDPETVIRQTLDAVRAPVDRQTQLANLTALSESLSAERPPEQFADFVSASAERTNVRSQREERARWMYRALTEQFPL